MQRIVFLDRKSLKAEVRRPNFPHQWEEYPQTLAPEVASRLAGATVAITNKVPIRRAALEQLPDLKMIAVAATGVARALLKVMSSLVVPVPPTSLPSVARTLRTRISSSACARTPL